MKKILITAIFAVMILSASCARGEKNFQQADQNISNTNWVQIQGVVSALDVNTIAVDFPVVIEGYEVREGDRVKIGQTLATLNLSTFKKQIQEMENELKIARKELERLEVEYENLVVGSNGEFSSLLHRINAGEWEIDQLKKELKDKQNALENKTDPEVKKAFDDLEEAIARFETLQSKFEGERDTLALDEKNILIEQLEKQDMVVQHLEQTFNIIVFNKNKEIKELQKIIDNSTYDVNNLKIMFESLPIQNDSAIKIQNEKIKAIEQGLNSLKNKLDREYLKGSKLISTIDDAIVSKIEYMLGETLDEGARLITLVNPRKIIVQGFISEKNIKGIELGTKAEITPVIDEYRRYDGYVTRISAMPIQKNNESVIPVDISLDNMDDLLIPNMTVNIRIVEK